MIRIVVNNRVCIPLRDLTDDQVRELERVFTHDNPKFHSERAMGFQTKESPFIRTYRHQSKTDLLAIASPECAGELQWMTFPRGGMQKIREVLGRLPRRVFDERITGDAQPGLSAQHGMTLYPYQEEAVKAAIEKQNALIRAPTGSGKTTAAIALAARIGLPTLIVVWSSNLADQWVKRINKELGIPIKEIGRIQGAKRKIKPITVAMQPTLAKCAPSVASYFGTVICDEVQKFAANTFIQAVDPFPAKYRIGISADETRKDRKEFLIYDLFGSLAADISQNALIDAGFVLDVDIRVIPTSHRADWYETDRNFDRLLKEQTKDLARNRLALDIVKREVQRGEQIFVLSHRVDHCMIFDRQLATMGIKSGILIGGDDHKVAFTQTREGLESGDYRAAVGTIPAIGQGLDIPSVARAVVVSPLAGNRQLFGQVRGRVCRTSDETGKTDAILYYLWDQHVYGRRHLENLSKWYRNVYVWDGMDWVPVKRYLASHGITEDTSGIFQRA